MAAGVDAVSARIDEVTVAIVARRNAGIMRVDIADAAMPAAPMMMMMMLGVTIPIVIAAVAPPVPGV
jgi:hypothetical protein